MSHKRSPAPADAPRKQFAIRLDIALMDQLKDFASRSLPSTSMASHVEQAVRQYLAAQTPALPRQEP